jgi:hypothetical protein
MADGWEPDEIAADSGMTVERVRSLVNQVYAEDGRSIIGRSSESIFVDYVIRSRQNLRALQDLREGFVGTNQGAAAVGAIKAQQDILDRMIKVGQELGYVEKKPDRKEFLFGRLDDAQLNARLRLEFDMTHKMAEGFANVSFLDVSPPPRMITARVVPEKRESTSLHPGEELARPIADLDAAKTVDPQPTIVRKRAVLRTESGSG